MFASLPWAIGSGVAVSLWITSRRYNNADEVLTVRTGGLGPADQLLPLPLMPPPVAPIILEVAALSRSGTGPVLPHRTVPERMRCRPAAPRPRYLPCSVAWLQAQAAACVCVCVCKRWLSVAPCSLKVFLHVLVRIASLTSSPLTSPPQQTPPHPHLQCLSIV